MEEINRKIERLFFWAGGEERRRARGEDGILFGDRREISALRWGPSGCDKWAALLHNIHYKFSGVVFLFHCRLMTRCVGYRVYVGSGWEDCGSIFIRSWRQVFILAVSFYMQWWIYTYYSLPVMCYLFRFEWLGVTFFNNWKLLIMPELNQGKFRYRWGSIYVPVLNCMTTFIVIVRDGLSRFPLFPGLKYIFVTVKEVLNT